jgi:hypothetical protein
MQRSADLISATLVPAAALDWQHLNAKHRDWFKERMRLSTHEDNTSDQLSVRKAVVYQAAQAKIYMVGLSAVLIDGHSPCRPSRTQQILQS